MVFRKSWRYSIKIALFGEDRFCEPLRIIARRILGRQSGIIPRYKKRGDLLNKQKICSHIENDILQEHPDVSKIIVCIDSECTSEKEMKSTLSRVANDIQKDFKKLSVKYCLVVHAIEGWFLADAGNIKKYLGSPTGVSIPSSATSTCKPKKIMKDIFKKAGKEYIPYRDNRRIAEKADIAKMVKGNKSFAHFRDEIKDP